ncbi:MAG: discoidin domain-containing protein, partial [Clostridium perfringens]|nr:discoidin domain-containing protein [Clostridium perfringens]
EEAKSYETLSEIYTVESYEALLEAIKHAEDVLENSSSEKEIGDAIINLRSKISKLEERETVEEDKIDSSKLEAIYATSEADRDYKENAVDGDENTIWHSAYQAADKLPVSITIKLDKAYDLNQIDYLPRQNSRNGHVTEYKIETSLDNENWTEVRTGNLEVNEAGNALANRGYNPIRFNTINAQYVRFTALKTLGDTNNKYASAAELVFYGKEGKVSAESITLEKTELKLNVNESEQLKAVLNPIESNDTITWTSSDESIAKVDENGVITGIGKGEALITATIPNGKSATAKVIVEDSVSEEIIVSPVRDFKASQVNKRDVTVTWTTPESTNGLEGYILYRDGKKVAKLEADETSYMFNKLNRHTIYNFKIAAKYSNGKISEKSSITIRTAR